MDTTDSETMYSNVTLNDFCRLCLQQCGAQWMRPFRSCSTNFGNDKVSIPDMLVYVCGLPSNLTDELPQRVCKRCVHRLEQAYLICREFKEKETILDRFYLNGCVLQRLVQYEKFRFDPEENEVAMEQSVESITKSETNVNDAMQTADVFAMHESQSGMEEADYSIIPIVHPIIEKPTDDRSDEHSRNSTIKSFSQPSIVSLDTDSDSDSSDEVSSEAPQNKTKQAWKPEPIATLPATLQRSFLQKRYQASPSKSVPLDPSPDGFFHCIHCPRRYSIRKHYMEHLGGHRALMEERYKCSNAECGKLFRKRDQLNRHTMKCCRRSAV